MGQFGLASSSHHSARQPDLSGAASVGFLARGFDLFLTWQERRRGRASLIGMADGMLKDIGLSRGDAESEYEKPFWRG